jgi:hypothetical protein
VCTLKVDVAWQCAGGRSIFERCMSLGAHILGVVTGYYSTISGLVVFTLVMLAGSGCLGCAGHGLWITERVERYT